MLIIKRININNDQSTVNNKRHFEFVRENLKRRVGNYCTFAFDFEMQDIINILNQAGFNANDDNYEIRLSESSDYEPGKIVYADGLFGAVPLVVKDIMQDNDKLIAKVKYRDHPRKRAIYINIKTENELQNEILKNYGRGMLDVYLKHTCKELSKELKGT